MAWYEIAAMAACFLTLVAGVIFAWKNAVIKPKIKNILLDADGTLLDFDAAERAALSDTFAALGLPFDEKAYESYHRNNAACWKMLEKKEITREQLKLNRYRMTFEELGLAADPAVATKVYEGKLGQYGLLLPGAEEAVEAMSKKYQVFIVTNGLKNVQTPRMLKTKIPLYVKGIYISEDVGFDKPAKEFFDKVFADHPKMKREETVIIGDSLSGDMAGGNNAGIKTCWVNPTGAEVPTNVKIDWQIENITQWKQVF